MVIKKSLKTLLKTTEGAIILGGLFLTVISPVFGPEFWAICTAIAYVLVNVPGILIKIKEWYTNFKSGNKN